MGDLVVRDVVKTGVEPLVVAPIFGIGFGSSGGHRDGIVVGPERVAFVQPRVGQLFVIAGPPAEPVSAPAGPPGIRDQISECENHVESLKRVMPDRYNIPGQFEAVAGIDNQILQVEVIAESDFVGAPGAACIPAPEVSF